jgi:hypothetical protein
LAHTFSPCHIGARAHGQFEAHTPSHEVGSQTRTREIREARVRAQQLVAEDVSASRCERTTSRIEGRKGRGSQEGRRTSESRTSESRRARESRCSTDQSRRARESRSCTRESSRGSREDDGESRRARTEARRRGTCGAFGARTRAARRGRRCAQTREQGKESRRRACTRSAGIDERATAYLAGRFVRRS